jgi:hypothetical protein
MVAGGQPNQVLYFGPGFSRPDMVPLLTNTFEAIKAAVPADTKFSVAFVTEPNWIAQYGIYLVCVLTVYHANGNQLFHDEQGSFPDSPIGVQHGGWPWFANMHRDKCVRDILRVLNDNPGPGVAV